MKHILMIFTLLWVVVESRKGGQNIIEQIDEFKDFKKLLRTKTNVLILFMKSEREAASVFKLFADVAEEIRGQGTLAYVTCNGEAKKLCKKLKANPNPVTLKHFKDGEFNKDYDRKHTLQSIVNFMRDPTGDIPWEEEDSGLGDVVHVSDAPAFAKLLKRESRPILMMFYAPWCGFCKRLKPVYVEAASELRGHSILAAMDANKPENAVVRQHLNVTGFPTLLYFDKGVMKFKYEGENTKDAIVSFMNNPEKPPEKPTEQEWSSVESDVVHLTDSTFEAFVSSKPSVLVMFYAPWCGHCKVMKPEYVDAASRLLQDEIEGVLAAVDATKETAIATQFNIRGFPSVKYFQQGEFKYDASVRTADKIIEFMKDPKEPPPPPPPEKAWADTESDIVHLDESNFSSFLKRKKHVLVIFYAPWCGHCKKAKPEFSTAAAHFKEDSRMAFVAIDCTVNTQLCSSHKVEGYPTIKYFSFLKTAVSYEGGRNSADFISFMRRPPSTYQLNQLTSSTFDTFISTHDSVLVLFEASDCVRCSDVKVKLGEAAVQLQNNQLSVAVATVDDAQLRSKFNVKQFPTLKYFRNGAFLSDFTGPNDVDDFVLFMNKFRASKDEL